MQQNCLSVSILPAVLLPKKIRTGAVGFLTAELFYFKVTPHICSPERKRVGKI